MGIVPMARYRVSFIREDGSFHTVSAWGRVQAEQAVQEFYTLREEILLVAIVDIAQREAHIL